MASTSPGKISPPSLTIYWIYPIFNIPRPELPRTFLLSNFTCPLCRPPPHQNSANKFSPPHSPPHTFIGLRPVDSVPLSLTCFKGWFNCLLVFPRLVTPITTQNGAPPFFLPGSWHTNLFSNTSPQSGRSLCLTPIFAMTTYTLFLICPPTPFSRSPHAS